MKIIKHTIIFVFILCSIVLNISAQIVFRVPSSEEENPDSICGNIESEQLSIPSYKFKIVDKNKNSLKNLRAVGELVITEGVWMKNGIFDLDPYWKDVYHNVEIPIFYDSKEDVYISKEVSKIKIEKRKKGGFFNKSKCLDKVEKFGFKFYLNEEDLSYFYYFFNNTTINKIKLPDATKTYQLELQVGAGSTKNN